MFLACKDLKRRAGSDNVGGIEECWLFLSSINPAGMITLSANQPSISSVSVHPLKVVALGDSVVYGFGDPEGGGWVERLRRRSMTPGSTEPVFYNLGVRGDSVQKVFHRFEQEFRLRGELRNRVPDLIVLSVGVNDSARLGKPNGRFMTPIQSFQQHMSGLLSRAKQLCPVLFVGMPPVDEAAMPFAEVLYYAQDDQQSYKDATRQACSTYGIPYLDIFDLWLQRGGDWWRSRLCPDGLHPNPLGYRSLLEDILGWESFQHHLAISG